MSTPRWAPRAREMHGTIARASWRGQNLFDGRANITAVAEFTKTDGLVGTQRADYAADLGFEAPATPGKYKTVLYVGHSVPQVNFGGIPLVDDTILVAGLFGVPNSAVGVTNASGQLLTFGPRAASFPTIRAPTPAIRSSIAAATACGSRTVSNLLSPTERINLDTLMHFQINEHINAFGEGYFSERMRRI